ncbi:GSF2 [Candida margitis]|uniref:GSF2 n=1 Tax=Candida margitis TaxID=1775924 RepID=UPI002226EEB0|nr:GSF2 [Candida margitis]KAI5956104.1 GSF2 [Candida margitis]
MSSSSNRNQASSGISSGVHVLGNTGSSSNSGQPKIEEIVDSPTVDENGQEIAYLDVYVRFNQDSERDYCFQIDTKTTFGDLFKIFKTLPIALRPSVFYHSQPIGFQKSTSPGYMTEDGNFLFEDDAAKHTSTIIPPEELINVHVWPGQLILPVWKFNYFTWYFILGLLAAWLYTDLPDFVSPTPGICLTNWATKFMAYVAKSTGFVNVERALIKDLEDPVDILLQCFFFSIHIVKTVVIFLFLYTGAFNPMKLFRLPGGVKLDVSQDELVSLGWTGTRKATIDEYKDYYRETKIKEYGGMVPAHQKGLFNTIRHLGVHLKQGEGYNTPLTKEYMETSIKELEKESKTNPESFKLHLNYEWFASLGYTFAKFADGLDTKQTADLIKQFRRYGLFYSDPVVSAIISARKHQDPQIAKDIADLPQPKNQEEGDVKEDEDKKEKPKQPLTEAQIKETIDAAIKQTKEESN